MNQTILKNYPQKTSIHIFKGFYIFLILALTLGHLFLGVTSLKRFVWLLKRKTEFHSQLSLLRKNDIQYYALIETIKKLTPSDSMIFIPCNEPAREEVSFYAFPRRVMYRKENPDICPFEIENFSSVVHEGGRLWRLQEGPVL